MGARLGRGPGQLISSDPRGRAERLRDHSIIADITSGQLTSRRDGEMLRSPGGINSCWPPALEQPHSAWLPLNAGRSLQGFR